MPDSVMLGCSLTDLPADDLESSGAPLGLRQYPDVSLSGCRCDSWFCPRCRVSKALRLRSWLVKSADSLFRLPRMMSVTVDPKLFESSSDAYNFVRGGRYISRLMGLFCIKRYVVVFECQKNGFPHWHILFDWDGAKMDFKRLRRLWRQWGIGTQVMVSVRSKKLTCNPVHAIRYITKYLLKGCVWPDWVLQMPRIRVFSTSRQVGAFNLRPAKDTISDERRRSYLASAKNERERTTILQRLERCSLATRVFRGDKYLYTLDVPWVSARECCERVRCGSGWRWLLVDYDALCKMSVDFGCNSVPLIL